jgi:hypothetical protein
MKLPNYKNAVIDDAKLRYYCLSELHDIGKHKALVFKSALGITAQNYLVLKNAIINALAFAESEEGWQIPQGKLFVVDFEMINFDKKAVVRTSWIIRNDEQFPRLTTCFVKT